jgi:hypothetical protein
MCSRRRQREVRQAEEPMLDMGRLVLFLLYHLRILIISRSCIVIIRRIKQQKSRISELEQEERWWIGFSHGGV